MSYKKYKGPQNFKGYFLQFISSSGETKNLPATLIAAEGISITPDQITEKDAWRSDSNNSLHRKVFKEKKTSFRFSTVDDLPEYAMNYLIGTIMKHGLVKESERKYRAKVWNPLKMDYQATAMYYIPDTEFQIDYVDTNGIAYYKSVTFELIQY